MSDFAIRRRMMVDTQIRPSDVTKYPIIEAMLSVPREVFVPEALREAAYVGENLDLGGGRVLLDPRTLAKMLEALNVTPGDLVLDVGAATGYSAAVLGRLAEAVVALEEDEALAREAESALAEAGADSVAVVTGPLTEGAARHGPYDVILLDGAIEELPQAIADQLAEHGRIAALFHENRLGVVRIGHKVEGAVVWRDSFNADAPVLPGFAATPAFAL